MSQLLLEIKNESILYKIIKLLEVFKNDGVEIKKISQTDSLDWSDEYVEKNWREIGMSTHSANLDENEIKYEAYARFHDEKHSS